MHTTSPSGRERRRLAWLAAALAGLAASAPYRAPAEGLFEFLFGGATTPARRAPQPNFFADPSGASAPVRVAVAGFGPAFCVRSCDGKYFALTRGNASPAEICQAFCPASPTKVFFGDNIDSASTAGGEHYADSENAFAYRKALRADCTCNGRDPAGLAPVDLALDPSLRPGDVVATTEGLLAYAGARTGGGQGAEFTPVASFPGLTADIRARLNAMQVAPVHAELLAGGAPPQAPVPPVPLPKDKRAAVD